MNLAEAASHSSVRLPSKIFSDWRGAARLGLQNGVAPGEFDPEVPEMCKRDLSRAVHFPVVPVWFLDLAQTVALHRDEKSWALLYEILWRYNHGETVETSEHPAMIRARFLQKTVLREMHKMSAFLRFREKDGFWFAWYEPACDVLESIADSLVARHRGAVWVVHTPFLSVRWNLRELEFSAGLARPPKILKDEAADTFARYEAAQSLAEKVKRKPIPAKRPAHIATPPANGTIEDLRAAAQSCSVCPFARQCTQTVFGEGPAHAEIMVVGEQPGDLEDREGRPFVGPAGAIFDEVLAELKINREELYVTNAVKHFKFEREGRRRIHQKPNASEIKACHPWLAAEIARIKPKIIITLGATAASSVCGRTVRVGKERTTPITDAQPMPVLVTWHPSAILRSIDEEKRQEMRAQLKADIKKAQAYLTQKPEIQPQVQA